MTTESYVRDPRFKVHMTGLKGEKGASEVVKEPVGIYPAALCESAIVCHHAHFDGLILSHHYGIKPAFWFDTLSMARLVLPHLKSHSLGALAEYFGLQEKSVPYHKFKNLRDLPPDIYNELADGCAHDVELTYEIFKRLLPYVPKEELRVIDLSIRLFTEPALRLDSPRLTTYLDTVKAKKQTVLDDLGVSKKDLASSEKFATLLLDHGVEPPVKPSPANPEEEIYAFAKTDDGMKELLNHDNPTVAALAAARMGVKSTLSETRCQRMIDMHTRGHMCVYLKYYGAHTGRWSGGDSMNWQNLPARGPAKEIRESILAPEGYVLVVGDLAQIECRMLNWLAGQEDVLDAFKEGRDLYSEGASRFYGRQISKNDKVERHLGKTLELGCGYGMGAAKFQITCRAGALGGPPILLNEYQSKKAIASYRDSHYKVVGLWKHAEKILEALKDSSIACQWGPMQVCHQRVFYPNGAWSDYSHLGYDDGFYTVTRKGKQRIYGAKLVENVVQALSRVVLSQAMLRINPRYLVVMSTHDEVVCLARKEEADEALKFVLDELRRVPAWCEGLPLEAEGGYDVCYSK